MLGVSLLSLWMFTSQRAQAYTSDSMANYYQNQSYNQETAPTEYLQQNYGFSPAYGSEQRDRVPPYPSSEEYMRQPATAPTAPYPTLPPLHQPQPQCYPAQLPPIHVQPAPVHVEQTPPRIVYVQPREDSHWCVKLCCECICAIVSSVLYTVLGILLLILVVGLVVYFAKFYKH